MTPKTTKLVVLAASLALVLGFAVAEYQKNVRSVVTSGSLKGLPDIAYDALAESYLVVWQERTGAGEDRDVMARVLNRDGSAASGVVALAATSTDERFPRVAASGSSSWTVVWSTGTSIEACAVDATGKAGDFRTVTTNPSRPVDRPDIGASSDGSLLIVWEEIDGTGLTVIKGRTLDAGPAAADGEEFLVARSEVHDLGHPSVNQAGGRFFVAWDEAVEARRADVKGRSVPAGALSAAELGEAFAIASDGAQNTLPSVAAFSGTEAFLVVWQRYEFRRDSDIAFAHVNGSGVQASGKLTDTAGLREIRPFASSIGVAGRALVTYQTAPSNKPRLREIAARTIGWGDLAASTEIALDPTREGGGNPTSVLAAGAEGRGLVVWDVREGEGTDLYSKEWLASELAGGGLGFDVDGPIVQLADVHISGVVTLNGLPQAGVLMQGFVTETRTDATGVYSGAVSAPYTGTITPVQPGFTFDPPSLSYIDVAADVTGQNYAATYVGGGTDIYEPNNDFATAAALSLGTTHDLVLNDPDWYRITVAPEDAGKDLKVRVWGTGFPDTTTRRDLDFAILDSTGKLLTYSLAGCPDETAIVCDVAAGEYYIAQDYIALPGTVYSLTVELSDAFGIGYVTGYVYDDSSWPIEGALVELYGVPFDWNVTRPMAVTDASGYYKIGWAPGDFTVRFNASDFGNDGLDWTPDANYLPEMYNGGEVVTVSPGETLVADGYLTAGGTVTGQITDGQGAPLLNARIGLYTSGSAGAGSALTDAAGHYSIDRIRAGNFAVQLMTPWGIPFINEWYDDRVDFISADPIGIKAGFTTSAVDGRLEERNWGAVEGFVSDALDNPVANMAVGLIDPAAGFGPLSVQTDAGGHYLHSRVPAGSWKVFFNAASVSGVDLVPQYYPGTRFLSEAGTIEVREGETTNVPNPYLPLAGAISGQILNNNGGVNVVVFDTAEASFSKSVSPGIPLAGPPTYTIRNLQPGTYKVMARPNQQGDRIPQWHPDAGSYAAAATVTVTAGATTSGIDITLATGGGAISGRVTDDGGYPIAGVVVFVQDATRQQNYCSWPSNDEGYYTVRQVPPGAVKVYYNADANWLNYVSEFYSNKTEYGSADAVTVTEGETTTLDDVALDFRPSLLPTTASLPAGELAVPYSQQLEAVGGRPFYRWAIQWGALPDGLALGANGQITGTPAVTGTYDFGVMVTDSTLPMAQTEYQFLSITVGEYTGEGFTISGTVTQGGSPLAGVVLDGLPGDPVTSATGTYVAVVEPIYWDTVTPVLAGYAFTPAFREYATVTGNLSGQDYAAEPGYRLSGKVEVVGAPLSGVRITGIPTEVRTDDRGEYSVMLPIGWSGTVIPALAGFSFSPPYVNYYTFLEDTAQDYTATFVGGVDDGYEENDTFAAAAEIAMGTVVTDLVLLDQDWFKFYVPAGDAGKVLGIRLFATAFPNGAAVTDLTHNKDLDYGVMDETGKLLTYSMSGSIDEVAFIPNIQPGWYTIGHTYMPNPGMVYALYVTTSDVLPVGTVSGRITNPDEQGIDGVTVELYQLPFDWNESHQMAITDADGNYKIAAFPGDYQVKVGHQDFDQNPTDGLPDGWLPVRNYLANSYDYDKTVTLAAETPVTGADVVLEYAGAISGRVTDGEGNPLQLARVSAYLSGPSQASVAYTDADGNYELRHLRSANYALLFRPPAGSTLAREWYADGNSIGASLPVPATAETTTAGIDAVLETGGQISGHVRNEAGEPIEGVTVAALDPSGIAMQGTTTQSDGGYVLNSLRAGSYSIIFNASTCSSGNYMTRGYGSGEPVPVADGQTTPGIDAVMYPAGIISGRLSNRGGDSPMSGLAQAFSASTGDMWAATMDIDGNYQIRNLPPGDYRVRFASTFGSITNYPPKWYPAANSGTGASLLTVAAGGTLSGIDGDLIADGGSISGRVTNISGGGIAGIAVQAEDGALGEYGTSRAITDAGGYYTVLSVPAGMARIFFQPGPRPFSTEFFNDKTSYASADAVPIVQGVTQPGIDAALTVRPSLALVTTSLPDGELGAAYAQSLSASGGLTFYHWSIGSGALPPGLALSPRGEISGTPTMEGTFLFMVRLTDSSNSQQCLMSELSITVGEYTGVGYAVSGTVTAGATPLAGVTLSGLPGEPVTNAAGGYVAIVLSGWSGTARPVLAGYAFTPAATTYANVSADFTAQDYAAVAGYTISGTVTIGGLGLAGVTMSGLPGEPLTDGAGGYTATVAAGSTLTVTPTLAGFTFAPASVDYTAVAADQTGQDYVATYAGGVDDAYEDNDTFETAALLPQGTTHGLVLRDEDWYMIYVPAEDAGKDLRVRVWAAAFPDPSVRQDVDFWIRDAAGRALSVNLSGSPDETAYICDVAAGLYFVGSIYASLEGTVYSVSLDLNEDFGLGYVEGTVRDDGGTPIPGVSVELYGEPFDWDISRPLIYTDAAGHYRIGYPPGPYTVRFNLAMAERDDLEWTPDANFLGEVYHSGEVLDVAPGATLSGIDGQLTPGGTITGTVTDASGNPLSLAAAWAYGGDGVSAASNLTDANGHYSLNRLRTGNYAVRFRDGNPYAMEWYNNDAASFAAAMPVAVVAGATTSGIDAALGTRGIIAGRVTNDSGDPIIGVQVTAYDPAGIALQSSTTDSNGYYGVGRLPTGSFKVLFNAATATTGNFVSEYYADQRYLSDGTDVEVTAGATTTGIDAVLALAGTISGRVTVAGGAGLSNVGVHAFDVDSDLAFSATTDALGNYTIINVPAANYKVRFRPNTGTWAVEWSDDKADFTTANALAVDVGQNVTGVDAELSDASVTVTGRVTNGSGAGIAGIEVIAWDTGRLAAYSAGMTNEEGYYSIPRLPTCQTKILFNADRAYLHYANEYYNDKAEYGTADAVTLTVGETPPNIDAVLAGRPALTVTTDLLPAGELAVGYSGGLAASGGRTLYHWGLETGALPDGLTLNGRGEITGMPTMAGTFVFTARVSDSTSPQQVATKELSITVGEYTGLGHTISGRVLFGGLPLAGVTLGGLPGEPVTNADGGYVAVVPDGWTGTATPALTGYIFEPVSYPYSNVTTSLSGQDFVASLGYTISGIVSLNAAPLEGVLMDGLPGNPLTDTMGYYAVGVPPGWSGTVVPTLEGYSFTPESVFYESVAADQTNQDYIAAELPPPGKLRWFVKDVYGYYLWMNTMLPDESFEGWLALQGGTSTAAATAVFNGELHVIVKDAFTNTLWHQSMDGEGAWSGWTMLGGESPSTPSMAVFNNKLYVAIQEPDNRISCKSMDAGGTWSEWAPFPGATSTTPVLASFNGKLHLVVKDLAYNLMWWNSMDATETWSGWQQLSGESPSPVAMAEYNDRLYMFVRGNTDDLYFRSMDTSGAWGPWTMMVGATSIRPTVAAFNGRLYLVVKDANGYYIWMRSMDETETFGDWTMLPGGTEAPITLVVF